MGTIIRFDPNAAAARVEKRFNEITPKLTMLIRDDCNEYCKWAEGALVASSFTASKLDEGKIIWRTPYARRQYWEIKTAHRDVHEKATYKWAHVAKKKHSEQWSRQAQKLMEGKG